MTPASGSWRHQALDLLRAAGLILRMCYRGSLPLTLVAVVVTPAAMVFGLLGALWVKLLADGVLRHDARQALGRPGSWPSPGAPCSSSTGPASRSCCGSASWPGWSSTGCWSAW